MKKGIAMAAAAVLTFMTVSTSVFAAPSPTAEDAVVLKEAVVIKEEVGAVEELSVDVVTEANNVIREVVAEILKQAAEQNASLVSTVSEDGTLTLSDEETPLGQSAEPELLAAFDFTPAETVTKEIEEKGYAEVEFEVPTIAKGDTVKILHYLEATGEWEVIDPTSVKDGKVTAKFTSFSPIVITKIPAVVAELDVASQSSFNATPVIIVLAVVAVIAAAGAIYCSKNAGKIKKLKK